MGDFKNQQEYNDKLAEVASLAVAYANTDTGWYKMRDAFNELWLPPRLV